MTQAYDYEARGLGCPEAGRSRGAGAQRRLGQYAVVWRERRAVCIGPDALGGVAEPGKDNKWEVIGAKESHFFVWRAAP